MQRATRPLSQLRRVRWGVRAALVLGVTVSVIANVLHAVDNPISQAIAAWPPIALLLTVELMSRIPVHSRALAAARLIATAVIAGIAAWVSYWHMAGVAGRYGETGASPYLIPISVDGLIVVASICLVELGGRIRTAEEADQPAQSEIDTGLTQASADVLAETPPTVPPADNPEPPSGTASADEPAAQKVRQDPRSAQEIEIAVRAIKAANPGLSIRKVAAMAQTSPTNAGRILREAKAAEAAQKEATPDHAPELAAATH